MRPTTGLANATRLRPNTIRPKRLSAASHWMAFPYPFARACRSIPSWSTVCTSRLAVTWAENNPSLFNRDPTASPMMANRSPKGDLALDLQVANGDGGHAVGDPDPVRAAIDAERETELGSHEEEPRIDVVLDDAPGGIAVGEISGDGSSGASEVGRFDDVRFEIAALKIIEGDVDGIDVGGRRVDIGDVGEIGDAGELVDLAPGLRAVFGDLHEAVVGADEEQSFLERRFGQRGARSVLVGEFVFPNGVGAPDLAHHREGIAVDRAREVGRNQLPG